MNPTIDLENITVVYRVKGNETRALKNLSFKAEPSFVAMLGPNGAGKSTLMGVISGMIKPNDGTIHAPTSRKALGIVFQTPALDELLTIRENIVLAGAMHALSKSESLARLTPLAAHLGINDRLNDQVRHLSGGLKRRADLARAIIAKPSVLLLDEPTTGLDIDARSTFWDLLKSMQSIHPMTIVLATHLTEEANLADRVLLIRNGEIITDDSPHTLKSNLGERIIRINTNDEQDHSRLVQWATDTNREFHESSRSLIVAHADQSALSSCPIQNASMTLTPPTLADVYTWHTQGGSLSTSAEVSP